MQEQIEDASAPVVEGRMIVLPLGRHRPGEREAAC